MYYVSGLYCIAFYLKTLQDTSFAGDGKLRVALDVAKRVPKPAKLQIRVYITEEKDRLLKAIAGIKSSVNAIVNEAIEHWLEEEEQKEIVEKFNLDRLDELD